MEEIRDKLAKQFSVHPDFIDYVLKETEGNVQDAIEEIIRIKYGMS